MLSNIDIEEQLNSLLPAQRLEHSPPAALLSTAREWSEQVWTAAVELGPMPLSTEQLKEGHRLAQCPVLICGVHRSGTTLIRDLLDGHPDLVVLPAEGTYYTVLERKMRAVPANEQVKFLGTEWLRRLVNPINQPPYWLLGRSTTAVAPYIDFARYLLAWWEAIDKGTASWPQQAIILAYASVCGQLKARCWVDKTPLNERFLGRARREMPAIRVIHAIREPIATLSSRKVMEPTVSMRTTIRDIAFSFRVAVEQTEVGDPHFRVLRYEDICDNPQKVMEDMASFLGVELLPILNQPTVAGMPSKANSSFSKTAIPGEILKPGDDSRYAVLSVGEQDLIASYLGTLSAKLAYPLRAPGLVKGFMLKLRHGLI